MEWQITFSSILLVFVSVIVITVAYGLWWKRSAPGAQSLIIMMLAIAFWCFSSALEYAAVNPNIRLFTSKLQYIGIFILVPMYVIFGLKLSLLDRWITKGFLSILGIVPITTILLVFTNEFHGLVWADITQVPGHHGITYTYGLWFWFATAYSYICLLVGSGLVVYAARNRLAVTRFQTAIILTGVLIPWLANILYISGLFPIPGIDPTPFVFAISGILLTISIYRFQIFNITPIARDKVVDTMNDLLFVIDDQFKIIDLNPAASHYLGKTKSEIKGLPASEVFEPWPSLAILFKKIGTVDTVIRVVQDDSGHYYDTHISPLRTQSSYPLGWAIVLHEITQLKEAELRVTQLAAVIEQAHETIVITDMDGNITYVNPFFEQTTGYSTQDVLGKNPNILKSGKQQDEFYESLWDTILQGQSWTGNFVNKRKDGSFYYESATIFPIKNHIGEVTSFAAVKRDITDQIEAEKALLSFTEKLETLHDISLILSQSKSLDELLHLAVKHWHGKIQPDRIGIWFTLPNDPAHLKGSFGIDEQGNLRDERYRFIEVKNDSIYINLTKEGKRIFYNPQHSLRNHKGETIGLGEAAASPLWDGQNVRGYVSIDNYLTQQPITPYLREILVIFAQTTGNLISRKIVEESIKISERQYRLLADNATDVIWIMDLEGIFSYISPAVELIRGYTPGEALSQPLDEIFTPLSLEILNNALSRLNQMILNGDTIYPLTLELEQKCKDGSTILTESIISIFFDEDTESFLLSGVSRDITERKRTENELERYARNQKLLNEITSVAIQQKDFDDTLQILADRLGELINADGCYITLWDEANKTVLPAAAYGPFRESYQEIVKPQPGEATLTESALNHGDVLVIENVLDSQYVSPRIAKNFPTRSGIALPLIANNQKLGGALIAFNVERKFSESEIEICKQAAQQIALAILKNRLLEEAQDRAREAETLRQASTAIVTTLEHDQAIERILEELNRVIPYDSASVLLINNLEMQVVGARGFKNSEQILNLRFDVMDETPNKVVYETCKPFILSDARDSYAAFRKAPHNHIRGWMGIPLLIRDQLIGMLALDSSEPDKFDEDDARLAAAFADQVAIVLENTRLFEETRRLAMIDSLTQLYNRRHFMDLSRKEFERALRYQIPLSIIMIDIDHFKKINDTFGHLVGDQVLQTMAFICQKNLRSIDIIGRYGGEEFIILLPETPLTRPSNSKIETNDLFPLPARIVAERLRKTIANEKFEIGEASFTISISLGIAELDPNDKDIETVIDHADQALLQAKKLGRNNVVTWESEDKIAEN